MPNKALQNFLHTIKKADKTPTEIKLSLETPEEIKLFLAALREPGNKGIPKITKLDLCKSKFNQKDSKELVEILNTLPQIQTLRLDNCGITDDCSTELANLTHIRSLSLRDNLLGRRPAFNSMLQSLYLDNNTKISPRQVLFSLGLKAKALKTLSLKNCGVTDEDLSLLGRENSKLENLTYLNLYMNNITHVGMEYLSHLKLLKKLDIGRNTGVGNDGIKAIVSLNKLRILYADDCGVGGVGLVYLSQMQLDTVDLSYNPGLKQAWDFVDREPNNTIRTLKLQFCSLNDHHAKALRAQFKALTHFNGANNSMTRVGISELLENHSLVTLDVSTQQLYRKPTATASNKGFYSPRDMTRKRIVQEAKEKIEFLLNAIRKAPALKSVNLEHTGLTDNMLLSLIPEQNDKVRKLRRINGVSCEIQKATLEKQIESKKEAKQLAQAATSSQNSAKKESMVRLGEAAESAPSPVELVDVLAKKEQLIGKLQMEIERLREALGKAKQRIEELKGPEPKADRAKAKPVVPSLVIPEMFRPLEKSLQNKPQETNSSLQPT